MAEKLKYDDTEVTMWNAKIAEDIEKARVKRLERIKQEDEQKIRRGEWIPADIVDKTQVGFVTMMLQTLTNKLTSLPPRLAMKEQSDINVSLEAEFKDIVIQLKKALKKALVHDSKQ
jgi:imidazoleglycerol phosphate dehydratase HisB